MESCGANQGGNHSKHDAYNLHTESQLTAAQTLNLCRIEECMAKTTEISTQIHLFNYRFSRTNQVYALDKHNKPV